MSIPGLREYPFNVYYGMNNSSDPTNIGKFEAVRIENFLLRNLGNLTRREGLTVIGNDTGDTKILGLTHFINGAIKVQIRTVGSQIEKLSTGTWSALSGGTGLTSDLYMNYCSANNFIYGFNGTDTVRKINNTSVTTVAGIPVGRWAVWWRNILFVGGVTAYPGRVYFSDLNDPETFQANSYIDVEPGDGDALTSFVALKDKIIITKRYSCHYLVGSGTNTFAVYPITYDFGCVTYRAAIQLGNDVWVIDSNGRIRSIVRNQYGLFDGKDMSADFLEGTIADVNKSQLSLACAGYVDGYALFAVPTGSSLFNDLVLVYDFKAPIPANRSPWVTFTGWSPSVFDTYAPSDVDILYLGEQQTDSLVYQWIGSDDNGTAIEAVWEGPNQQLDSPGQRKRLVQMKLWGTPLGNYNIEVFASIDNGDYTSLGYLNLNPASSTWGTGVWGTFVWGTVGVIVKRFHYTTNSGKCNGKFIQHKFVYNSVSASPQIGNHAIYYKDLPWR